ncbi:helix-turn-helix transcriptional regulator [Neobacillus drentensis]|uniref:helix-turn-helix transcriptional regulator n=1 Tax=Neobacillus drentensis TaxID=220684 RepID=UPI002FFD7F99
MFSLFGFGLGKKRSKFGRFLDKNSITQQEIANESGVSKSTISRLCQPEEFEPTMSSAKKIIKALRDFGFSVDYDDFWSM